jgi:hypothetical protein
VQGKNMAGFNYLHTREVADKLIKKFGMLAALRNVNTGVDRDCWVVITDYMPRDEATQLANPTDRRVLISAGLGAVPEAPPDNEQDNLVTFVQPVIGTPVVNEVLPFTSPVKPTAPAGIIVLFESTVRR